MGAPIIRTTEWDKDFDTIIDVRSPAEYHHDHIDGAINLPVLDDAQRAEVGTMHKKISPFAARRHGAALISVNIAGYLQTALADKPNTWSPLIYCWRGGQRSEALARILSEIGWKVFVLEGGYKRYRNDLTESIAEKAKSLQCVILQGRTGSGKTEIIKQYIKNGLQAIDLEGLANHRGSLLGALPGTDQPSQRMFESQLYVSLSRLDLSQPVLLEAESSKVGALHIPAPLWSVMTRAPRVGVALPLPQRVEFIIRNYRNIIDEPAHLKHFIDSMRQRHSHELRDTWQDFIAKQEWENLVSSLITHHYDPSYDRVANRHKTKDLGVLTADTLDQASIMRLADEVKQKIAASARP